MAATAAAAATIYVIYPDTALCVRCDDVGVMCRSKCQMQDGRDEECFLFRVFVSFFLLVRLLTMVCLLRAISWWMGVVISERFYGGAVSVMSCNYLVVSVMTIPKGLGRKKIK